MLTIAIDNDGDDIFNILYYSTSNSRYFICLRFIYLMESLEKYNILIYILILIPVIV